MKSHVNFVVADTDSWEQRAAKVLEEMPQVQSYVKNHFLGFGIPYWVNGKEHRYAPDFIARVLTPRCEVVNLVIEISGFSNDRLGNKDAKRYYTEHYWLPAANNLAQSKSRTSSLALPSQSKVSEANLGTYGRWHFIEVSDIDNIRSILNKKIQQL